MSHQTVMLSIPALFNASIISNLEENSIVVTSKAQVLLPKIGDSSQSVRTFRRFRLGEVGLDLPSNAESILQRARDFNILPCLAYHVPFIALKATNDFSLIPATPEKVIILSNPLADDFERFLFSVQRTEHGISVNLVRYENLIEARTLLIGVQHP